MPSENIEAAGRPPKSSSTAKSKQIKDQTNEKNTRRAKSSATAKAWLLLLGVLAATFVCPKLDASQRVEEVSPIFLHDMEQQQGEKSYCSSMRHVDQQVAEECAPCPANAECSEGILTCNPGYKLQSNKLSSSSSPATTSQKCVEDLSAKAKAIEVLALLTALLKERKGRYDCGLPIDPLFTSPDKQGENTCSSAIKKMCSGPGLTRWQMHFHPILASAIADEGVYFWLFSHFLAPHSAADLNIHVERHYMFVPIANPVDFPDMHERLMMEQRRSKGLTFTYAYDGPEPKKPLTCNIREMIGKHLLTFIATLVLLIIGTHLLHLIYMTHYVRGEMLSLIRQYSHYNEATLLTQGVATETLVQLLRERLDRAHSLSRLLLKNKITPEIVDEVCHGLLWTPNTGIHAYRLNETNHWWAGEGNARFSSHDGEDQRGVPSGKSRGPQVWSIQQPVKAVSYGVPQPKVQSVPTSPPRSGERFTHSQLSYPSDDPLMSCTQAQHPIPNNSYWLAATLQV
ncbi:hypothetical protein Esti_006117 [Eimeria stiedai]